jgi:hypothetical protein
VISLEIPDNIDEILKPNLSYWNCLQPFVNNSSNSVLQIAHKTVEVKIHYANLHLFMLLQTYREGSSFELSFIRHCLTENIITNLNSVLESIAHVINEIYNIGINFNIVSIDHRKSKRDCLRCLLKNVDNYLAEYLDAVLVRGSPVENWYEALRQYRHQIAHRPHSIFMLTIGGTYLPDDPSISVFERKGKIVFDPKTKEPIIPNYTKNREIRSFTKRGFYMLLQLIEGIYSLIYYNERFHNDIVALLDKTVARKQ